MPPTGTETSRGKNKFLFSLPLLRRNVEGQADPLVLSLPFAPPLVACTYGWICVKKVGPVKSDLGTSWAQSGFGRAVSLAIRKLGEPPRPSAQWSRGCSSCELPSHSHLMLGSLHVLKARLLKGTWEGGACRKTASQGSALLCEQAGWEACGCAGLLLWHTQPCSNLRLLTMSG